ncbi:2-C-methyl-D-erythritol 4-phosphate cytidylyltransferase [Paenibacillus sp. F411]|uniref:2-C-methyl-D-erythritol 4-phosphate cytidylyltransferase n=1 Tax=Paenibacillus algicola TaxID=2565926 RepID=A0A4P8XNL0_9BACL|nr:MULTISPECIES: 2-C-methyl-D-erythritol 4-phosphate cytidylyltransferase [Paenibacillus]MBO2945844.1 2-C-methyl-D-erythritol 4-phosphate cytidylyltransferase [Paenibacillus sp. F411]QCT04466.1 2-C-methyl-D-erythritol 4-phosphate cytidylyltransferase [Paenibacillus algicola]
MFTGFGAVIVAAGKGSRMGTRESKQFLDIGGRPIVVQTLDIFNRLPWMEEIVLVTGEDDVPRCQDWISEYGLDKVKAVVPGGRERQESVYLGILQLHSEWVMIHDGVRPFVTHEEIAACRDTAIREGAAVLAVPVKDTIKQVNGQGLITGTPARQSLWAVHTPQAFRLADLLRAHETAQQDGFTATDDAMLLEHLGLPVAITEGKYSNIKITTPDDLVLAALMTRNKEESDS